MKKLFIVLLLLFLTFLVYSVERYDLKLICAFYIIDIDMYFFGGYIEVDDTEIQCVTNAPGEILYKYEKKWLQNRTYKLIIIKTKTEIKSVLRYSNIKNLEIVEITLEEFKNLFNSEI